MVEGQKIRMGGREFIVPPLTLGQLKRLAPKIALLSEAGAAALMTPDQIDAVAEVVAAALSRNDPDMTGASVLELLDVGNAAEVYAAVLTGSGLRRGDDVGEGEPVARDSAEPSTASTALSPPVAAIPSPRSTP